MTRVFPQTSSDPVPPFNVPQRVPGKARRGTTQPAAAPMARTATRGGEELACEECDQAIVSTSPDVIRIRIGNTRFSKRGTVFEAWPKEPTHFLHRSCANRCSSIPVIKTREKCPFCGHQFFGPDSDEPSETVLEFTIGQMTFVPGEPEPYFSGEEQWLTHWSCASSYTALRMD